MKEVSKMKLNIGMLSAIFSGIGAAAAVAATVDQLVNADKRALIIGDSAGRAAVDETEKRFGKSIFGARIED